MDRINRDTIVAIVLLVLTVVLFWASFEIREPDYGVLPPSAWPRLIIGVIGLLSFIYLVQSVTTGSEAEERSDESGQGFIAFVSYWRNPVYCFILFFLFLLTMPVLGMLLGGMLFVFMLLNSLGGWRPRQLMTHALIAVLTMGTMWSIFTFGLKVILPPGTILNIMY